MDCIAYIEKDTESGLYVGSVPGLPGAHTCAESVDELHSKLREVISLCLEEMGDEEIKGLPVFQREVFDKLREAEREAAEGTGRLTDAEVFDSLIPELEAMPDGASCNGQPPAAYPIFRL